MFAYFGTLDYAHGLREGADARLRRASSSCPGTPWALGTVICIGLFVGAMGKSAQFPLHVWLPDSMEGPTPISALIHAATMVTAGIFMVARMSPLFELSQAALSFVIVIGAITAFFMALVAIVQYDIKRVVAYSTLSQLGYMTMALGAAAYPVAIFHLMTHAFFKAVLFLGAGSVIIALHHEQDMRKMGGLRKYMPITYAHGARRRARQRGPAALRGVLLQGFDHRGAAPVADAGRRLRLRAGARGRLRGRLLLLPAGVLRLPRQGALRDATTTTAHAPRSRTARPRRQAAREPWVVTVPLVLLAIPSVLIGWITIEPMLYGGWFGAVDRGHARR